MSHNFWFFIAPYQMGYFKPQYPHTNSPDWSSYISLEISWESLIKDQSIFPLVIIWLIILLTISLDNVWILLGENWCWSLLGLKGLIDLLSCFGTFPAYFWSNCKLTGWDFRDKTDNRSDHSLFAWPLSVEADSMNKSTLHHSLSCLDLQGDNPALWLL